MPHFPLNIHLHPHSSLKQTDADVYIFLCGEKNGKEMWSPQIKLDNSKNNFERNMEDSFNLMKQKSLGELTQVKIGHNNSESFALHASLDINADHLLFLILSRWHWARLVREASCRSILTSVSLLSFQRQALGPR